MVVQTDTIKKLRIRNAKVVGSTPIITISTYLNVRNHLVESATECVYVPVRAWIPVNMPLNNMPMRCIP